MLRETLRSSGYDKGNVWHLPAIINSTTFYAYIKNEQNKLCENYGISYMNEWAYKSGHE